MILTHKQQTNTRIRHSTDININIELHMLFHVSFWLCSNRGAVAKARTNTFHHFPNWEFLCLFNGYTTMHIKEELRLAAFSNSNWNCIWFSILENEDSRSLFTRSHHHSSFITEIQCRFAHKTNNWTRDKMGERKRRRGWDWVRAKWI